LYYKEIPDYYPYHQFELSCNKTEVYGRPGGMVKLIVNLKNPLSEPIPLYKDTLRIPKLGYIIFGGKENADHFMPLRNYTKNDSLKPGEMVCTSLNVKLPNEKGKYSISFGIIYGDKLRGKMSNPIKIISVNQ